MLEMWKIESGQGTFRRKHLTRRNWEEISEAEAFIILVSSITKATSLSDVQSVL